MHVKYPDVGIFLNFFATKPLRQEGTQSVIGGGGQIKRGAP